MGSGQAARWGLPVKSILDKSFKYTPAAQTDISKTFARYRRAQRDAEEQRQKNEAEAAAKVERLPSRKTA